MKEQILALVTLVSSIVFPISQSEVTFLSPIPENLQILDSQEEVLAENSLDLTTRDQDPHTNQVFEDNILLALHYLKRDEDIDWKNVQEPLEVSFSLDSGEIFAFHDNVLPEFQNPSVTMNSEFLVEEGYKSVGGLGGNGVCHLASLMNWVASEARLEVIAKANHSFALIPGVPKEFGTSIRSQSKNQNLYIKNNFDYPLEFVFVVYNQIVNLSLRK